MNLPDFVNDPQFNTLRQRIGAPLSLYKVKISLPQPVRRARPEPLDTPLPATGVEIDGLARITVNPDGTLGYEGKRVSVHIRDVQAIGGNHHIPRFHISNCRTLDEMRHKGRFERYVVSDRDDDVFFIRIDSGPLKQTSLNVCQNCLDRLSWDGFSSESPRETRYRIVENFTLRRFFERYPKTPLSRLPKHTVDTAPLNDYPLNWDEISNELRRQLRYTCQECGLEVGSENRRFLHVHHRNGLKYDTAPENLRCLCIECHADAPGHVHIRALPEYAQFKRIFENRP